MAKNNANYWNERQAQFIAGLEKDESVLMEKLSKEYEKQLASLDKDIARYYARYGEADVIEYRNLLKELPELDKRLLIENMEAFRDKYPEYAHLMPIKESIYKLDRLEGLEYEIYLKQCELGIKTEKECRKHLEELAARAYHNAGGKNMFGSQIAQDLVNSAWVDETNFSKRIWKNTEKLSKTINNELKNGFIRGDSYERMMRTLRKKFGTNYKDTYRLVYTEGTYIYNEASMRAFEDNSDQYEFSSILDKNTCEICAELNGEIFDIKDREPGRNFPPMHPRCRCSFKIVIPSLEEEFDGHTLDTTYYQDSFGKKIDKQIPGEKAYRQMIKTKHKQGTSVAKNAMDKYVGDDAIADLHCMGAPRYERSENKVYLNIEQDFANSPRGNGAQFFHELGHYIDRNAGDISQNEKFRNALYNDFENHLQKIENSHNVDRTTAENILKKELLQNGEDFKYKHGISDIVDGITNGQIRGSASHTFGDPFYWMNEGNLERESFAHMYESCYNKAKAKAMSEYFPSAYDTFKKTLKGMI